MALPHARPGQTIDLAPLGTALRQSATHAILKTPALELMRVVLLQGKALPAHSVRGESTIFCIEGELLVEFDGSASHLKAGQLMLLSGGVEHTVRALSDASALLTVQLPAGQPGSGSSTA